KRQPNRLIGESSLYLRQHAYNPVDWYPWGEEAWQRARQEDKPVFLSIGYSACHWCHVMERESFEDESIAEFLNAHFISIKVDREERPDLDLIYQRAAQVTGTPGGWPLSVFLLPDGRPFWIGTYLPPEDRYGRPGFPRVLRAVLEAFRQRRAELEEVAERIVTALAWVEQPSSARGEPSPVAAPRSPQETLPARAGAELLELAAAELLRAFDERHGGFGRQPKFPNTTALELLWRYALRTGRDDAAERVLFTLRRMAYGGLYDQLGGGFHRYTVDAAWQVPHFEKMLYDNALLVPLYLAAFRRTGDAEAARIARETLDYVLRELTSPDGAFYATQDADSEGEEGKYYVWRPDQLEDVLGPEDARLAARYWGVTPAGNFEGGATVLHVAVGVDDLAAQLGLKPDEVRQRLERARRRLLEARARRVPPATDTKILTAWNGLMVAALAEAGWTLGEGRYLEAAERGAKFLLAELRAADGGLLHVYQDGRARIPGNLDDYAFLISGLLKLHEATLAPRWLAEALALGRRLLVDFWDEERGWFYYTPRGGEALIHRPRDIHDTSTPSATGAALAALVRLGPFSGDVDLGRICERALAAHEAVMRENPFACASLILAADEHTAGLVEVTLAGPAAGDGRLRDWHRRLGRLPVPGLLVTRVPAAEEAVTGLDPTAVPAWSDRRTPDGRAVAYVCRGFSCSAPIEDWQQIEELVAGSKG
ncbi:MAG TPA: thioredoxin domain-containing protein, partial [Bacillota bacterium]